MTSAKPAGSARKLMTRILATGALLAIYSASLVATTGVVMTTGITPASAGRGRGRGRRGGRGRGSGSDAAIGLGIGAAILGGALIANEAARQNAIAECKRKYGRAYDAESNMVYLRGREFPCP